MGECAVHISCVHGRRERPTSASNALKMPSSTRLNSVTLLVLSLVLPAAHLLLTVATRLDVMHTEGSWGWFLVFIVDLPVSLTFLRLSSLDPLLLRYRTRAR